MAEPSSAPPGVERDIPGANTNRPGTASVSAGIAAATAHLQASAPERLPGENGGRSLAEIAHTDLDAALQLLAERAQYITEASGAAIALRRGEHNDMLCRASAGSNAPELGALLSMDYGLSGESVRTRQVLRCEDAERDPRVNHEVCRQLGIASVVVMPVVSDQQVLGVFEILSGKPGAFGDRDLSALRRLSELVEIAVKYAVAAQATNAVSTEELPAAVQPTEPVISETVAVDEATATMAPDAGSVFAPDAAPPAPEKSLSPLEARPPEIITAESEKMPEAVSTAPPKKPLFWSAAVQTEVRGGRAEESIPAPPGLRNLQKCQACGFPVSQGRTFCVECEEKQWRGQRLPRPAASSSQPARGEAESKAIPTAEPDPGMSNLEEIPSSQTIEARNGGLSISPRAAVKRQPEIVISSPPAPPHPPAQGSVATTSDAPAISLQDRPPAAPAKASPETPGFDHSAAFLSSALESESWLAANKYILGTLLIVAIVIAVIVFAR